MPYGYSTVSCMRAGMEASPYSYKQEVGETSHGLPHSDKQKTSF